MGTLNTLVSVENSFLLEIQADRAYGSEIRQRLFVIICNTIRMQYCTSLVIYI
jgi:hypothetical protein